MLKENDALPSPDYTGVIRRASWQMDLATKLPRGPKKRLQANSMIGYHYLGPFPSICWVFGHILIP